MKFFASLRVRLMLLVLLASIPFLLWIIFTTAAHRLEEAAHERKNALGFVRQVAFHQQSIVENARRQLELLARRPELRELNPQDCSQLLADQLQHTPLFVNLAVMNIDGSLFASALPVTNTISLSETPFFQQLLKERAFVLGQYQVDATTGKPTLTFAIPIFLGDQVNRALFAALDLEEFNRFTYLGEPPEGATVTAVSRRGTILARYPDPRPWVGQCVSNLPLIQTVLHQFDEGWSAGTGIEGQESLSVYRKVQWERNRSKSAGQNDHFYVVMTIPKDVLYAASQHVLYLNSAGLALVILLALAAAWWGGNWFILRRIKTLLTTVRQLGAGELQARTGMPPGEGEISELAQAFDEMAESLEQREWQLRESEEQYRALAEAAHDSIFIADRNRQIRYVNSFMAEQLGSTVDQLVGQSIELLFPPSVFTAERRTLEEVFETAHPVRVESKLQVGADRKFWLETWFAPLRDSDGIVRAVLGVSREITERKQAAEALRRAHNKLEQRIQERTAQLRTANEILQQQVAERIRAEQSLAKEHHLLTILMDNIPDIIYFKDRQSRFIRVNKGLVHWYHLPDPEYTVGKSDFDFFTADYAQQAFDDEQTVIRTGQPIVAKEERETWPDGRVTWVSTTKEPLRDESGAIVGTFGISRDITERKLAEERLGRAYAELAKNREELLQTLAELNKSHEQLKSTQLQLIQAEKLQSLGRLAAGVAHEVKNPLAIMKLGVEYLAEELAGKPGDTDQVLQTIQEALQRADVVVRGLLDFSAPRDLNLQPESLNPVIDRSLLLVKHDLARNKIDVVRNFDPQLPGVLLDRQKLEHVFVNVFENATQAMAQGGTLTIRTYTKTLQDSEVSYNVGSRSGKQFHVGDTVVVVEVDDTGPGIPSAALSRVFDPFFTTKPAGKGTGLGLTVAHKVIELHNGIISLSNRPEGGTRCSILFKSVPA